jgi:hypothetical protein
MANFTHNIYAKKRRSFFYPFSKTPLIKMKYCEYSGCNKKAEGILSFGGIKNYYRLKHARTSFSSELGSGKASLFIKTMYFDAGSLNLYAIRFATAKP